MSLLQQLLRCSNEREHVGWSSADMNTCIHTHIEHLVWSCFLEADSNIFILTTSIFAALCCPGFSRSNGRPRLAMTFGDTPFHRHLLALSAEYERVVGENTELRREHFGGLGDRVGDGIGFHMLLNMGWLVLIVYGFFRLLCWEGIGVGALCLKGSAIGLGILPLARGAKRA